MASEVGEKRVENRPEVHFAVNKWIRTTKADIDKAGIDLRRTHASRWQFSAFVCPSCDETMGQYYISRIRPENWSVLGGPSIHPLQEKSRPEPLEHSGPFAAPEGGGPQAPPCDRCHRDPHPEYECLWRQLRTRANIPTGSSHSSDVTYARISRGAIAEDQGVAL